MVRATRMIGAILLATCLALPMATCSAVPAEQPESAPPPEPTANYVVNSPSELPWALAFLWPFGLLAARRRITSDTTLRVLWWAEPLLVVATVVVLQFQVAALLFFGRPAIGFWVGVAAVALLLLAWLAEAAQLLRARRLLRKRPT